MEESVNERNWRVLQENRDRFVEIVFKGGETVHAHLCIATQDMDGTRVVIYDLHWTDRPESRKAYKSCAFCDDFEAVVDVKPLPAGKVEEYLAQQLKLRT